MAAAYGQPLFLPFLYAGFQHITTRHQLIDAGDDVVLFGNWRQRNQALQ